MFICIKHLTASKTVLNIFFMYIQSFQSLAPTLRLPEVIKQQLVFQMTGIIFTALQSSFNGT